MSHKKIADSVTDEISILRRRQFMQSAGTLFASALILPLAACGSGADAATEPATPPSPPSPPSPSVTSVTSFALSELSELTVVVKLFRTHQ